MPKIEVHEERFFSLIGRRFTHPELEEILTAAKGELDEVDSQEGILKLELNDTNRPDLWSAAGLARQLEAAYAEMWRQRSGPVQRVHRFEV